MDGCIISFSRTTQAFARMCICAFVQVCCVCACVINVSSVSSLAAGTVWDAYADQQGLPLWQLQITHEVQRSIMQLDLIRAALPSV